MTIGERIKALRVERGLTLEEVGNRVGVGKSTVRKWESGDIANMRRDKIAKLAEAFCVSPMYIMGYEDDAPAPQPIDDEEAELMEYLDMLRSRPECRLLLKTHKGSTKEEVLILSSQEKAFILWLRSLPPEKRQAVLNFQDMF